MSVAASLTLEDRRPGRIRPDLSALRAALEELGSPHLGFESVLVVGTNGKGSTAVMLEAILRAHGLTTGLFTSPHLVDVEERVRLDGVPVEAAVLSKHLDRLAPFPDLTYFETITAAAFSVFAEKDVDVAVLEAGMGGSWDATRLAGSRIAGITNVGTDHRMWLGSERSEIARDKGRAVAAASYGVIGDGVEPEILARSRCARCGRCGPGGSSCLGRRRKPPSGLERWCCRGRVGDAGSTPDVERTTCGRPRAESGRCRLAAEARG